MSGIRDLNPCSELGKLVLYPWVNPAAHRLLFYRNIENQSIYVDKKVVYISTQLCHCKTKRQNYHAQDAHNDILSLRSLGGGVSPFLIFSPQYILHEGKSFSLLPFGGLGSNLHIHLLLSIIPIWLFKIRGRCRTWTCDLYDVNVAL